VSFLETRSWTLAGDGRQEFHHIVNLLASRSWLKSCLCDMFGGWYVCTTSVDGNELSLLLKEIKLDVYDNIDMIPWGCFNFTVYNLSCFEKGLLTPPIENRDWRVGG